MNFYVGIHLLVTIPGMYVESLRKILGGGAPAVESSLVDRICKEVGIDRAGIADLEQLIQKAKEKGSMRP